MLSKRLQAIADYIPSNSNIIDVASDHGLLSIYLNKYKNCNVTATDISINSINKIKKNITKYKANINYMQTDGLKNIEINNKIIIIAGLGTHTILKILDKKITNDLVICSNNYIPLLRKSLIKKGYRIYNEKLIFDKTYYIITYYKYKKGKKYTYISPYIKDKEYLKKQLNKYQIKYKYSKKIIDKIKYLIIKKRIKQKI